MKRAIEDLVKWQTGYFSSKVEIVKGEFGWGVHAKEDLDEGVEIVKIKRDDEITVERAVQTIGSSRISSTRIEQTQRRFPSASDGPPSLSDRQCPSSIR